ncbi:riboflavin synthase [Solitalea koreensis]|uniref:Riboflavin synthase n=1 Tax=Solitalea koreensis TaxID=543615 RepID=A0A521D4A3_9SPHI|nr:riboflavin synthase [Solitalea koreensis]SMO65710.1 riboflavin synthase alpha chain [Solitalea koreensis]
MFTGIIETLGVVKNIEHEGSNLHFTIESSISNEMKVDQSIAHNGVCLTVVKLDGQTHTVTAIEETLNKTNLGKIGVGDKLNLERCMLMNGRLDGHIVQGHVDQTGICSRVEAKDGSWEFTFQYDPSQGNVTVEKGSITVNGTSLTVVNSKEGEFSVAIIPYTYEHTSFHMINIGTVVNLEFDIIGKYVARLMNK